MRYISLFLPLPAFRSFARSHTGRQAVDIL